MKRTTGYVLMALGILALHGLAPAAIAQRADFATVRAAHSRTSIVAADDSGSGDSGDDSDDDDSQ